jgi:lipopolysaccharide/colanic/teichoic acid biosynthesis glycosyltransferase
MDISVASAGLILASPLFLAIAALIKIASSGPALLKQQRIGRYGKPFSLWKFRTMHLGANCGVHEDHLKELIARDAPMVKLDAGLDSRIIPFGRILRRTCLDELPQLFNVLRGEMSLVGPRPCMPYEAQQYQDWQKRRFEAVPGMTGLWQVSGKNKTTFTEMVRLDIAYAERVSPALDLKILFKTIPAILSEAVAGASRRKQAAQVKRTA